MQNMKPAGNLVTYEVPAKKKNRAGFALALMALALLAIVGACLLAHLNLKPASFAMFLSAVGSLVFGLNTVAYEWPATSPSSTPPTAIAMRGHQQLTAIVTGDGTATSFTITHNMHIPTAQLPMFPEVEFEPILAAGITSAPIVGTKAADTITFTCSAFTGAGLRVRIKRPMSAAE
jgi:hypothetical protein